MGFIGMLKGEEPGPLEQFSHAMKGKGHFGEYLTEYALEHGELGNVEVFSNVLVPRSSGPTFTSEIDVLMLHEKGIFVFESKNYSGWIFGSADQRNWTMSLNRNTKENFYNPIKQNQAHVRALAAYLGVDENAFRSYIVFSERCELKKVPPDTDDYTICRRHHLLKLLRGDLEGRGTVFDAVAFQDLAGKLKALDEQSTEGALAAHITEAQQVKSGDVCPWCGSKLVERNGKYGPFMGCSGFPQCRFTRGI